MSFSSEAKTELCRLPVGDACCALAESYGALLFCNRFSGGVIRLVTESEAFALRLPLMFHVAFAVRFDQIPTGESGKFVFLLTEKSAIRRIYDALGLDWPGAVSYHLNFAVLENDCCRASFLRGAFLAGGSVTDPNKRYHLELATGHNNITRELAALLRDGDFSPKATVRAGNHLTYFKHSESIEDFLTTIGAPVAAMEVMTAKVEKSIRSSTNRRVNCDAANLDKTVEAAQEQIAAIRRLDKARGLTSLPDKLHQTALLRIENPELNLSQLAELCDPPVTKSALSHRLRKIIQLSEQD